MEGSTKTDECTWSMDLSGAQPWAWYALPDNRELYLPADSFSLRKYARKGWRLKPKDEPKNIEEAKA